MVSSAETSERRRVQLPESPVIIRSGRRFHLCPIMGHRLRSLTTPTCRLLIALSILAACSSAPDKRLLQYLNTSGFGKDYIGDVEEENYVTIGDTVEVHDVLHPDELTLSQKVDIDGTVLLPEIGTTHVAGYTRNELQALLTEKYSPYYDETNIQVQIRTKGKLYYIYGEVGNEGPTKFDGDLTIWQAVMKARPDKFKANLGRVRLIRPDPVDPFIIHVNIDDMIQLGDSTWNV
ncbi:MAG: hypothetical protein ACI841_004163, partial [Planctomycetota bacterium]